MTQAQMIYVTPVGVTNPVLIPVSRIFSIYANSNYTQTWVRFIDTKEPLEITQSLPTVWAQQSGVGGKQLNMIYVTDLVTSKKTIFFAQHLRSIVEINSGANSQLSFKNFYENVDVFEPISTIIAFQGGANQTNLGMVQLTRASDNKDFIFFTHDIVDIYPLPSLNASPTGSIVSFKIKDQIECTQTPAVIVAAMP